MTKHSALLLAVFVCAAVAACAKEADVEPAGDAPSSGSGTAVPADGARGVPAPAPGSGSTPPHEPALDDILHGLPKGDAQLGALCARGGTNKVTLAFCGEKKPAITGLSDLQKSLGLAFVSPVAGRRSNGQNGNPSFALSGHSSSLVARSTSAINPRAIVFSAPTGGPTPDFIALGFVRGEQVVEIAARDPEKNALRFFLVAFEQACNAAGGCGLGDLLTPAVERGWTSLSIYEDVDLGNTILDCTHCHQSAGPSTAKILRFQELRNPWTHFFRDNTSGGQALLADYRAAHAAAEDYGPIPAGQIDSSDPQKLEDLVRDNGFSAQPNEFPSNRIELEVRRSSPGQPTLNLTPGTSASWESLYGEFLLGRAIAPPYHDVKVTDPQKLASMTAAYREVAAGTRAPALLPDIRDVFLDSAAWRMGFAPKPGLSGSQLLVSMCQSCHNPALDQTVSRARFDVTKLGAMDRKEKDKAIARLLLPATSALKMPPERFRSMGPAEIQLAVDELRK